MLYLQIDGEGRILGVSEEQDENFPIAYDGDVPETFDDYIYLDGHLVYDQRPENAEYERQQKHVEKMACLPTLAQTLVNTVDIPDEIALEVIPLYPEWSGSAEYTVDFKVQYDGLLYRCLQAHTSQEGWTPDVAASLWARVLIPDPGTIPEWEQPSSTNPYMAGDKVRHNEHVWISDVDNNVWEPGVYGWTQVE